MPETYRIGILPSGYVTERSKIASAGGWERTLSGQSGRAGRDGEINARRLKGAVGGRASVAEILRREPIPLIMRSGNVPSRRALLMSSSLFLYLLYLGGFSVYKLSRRLARRKILFPPSYEP